jgi:hypothetical protein
MNVNLALQAIRNDPTLSIRAAALSKQLSNKYNTTQFFVIYTAMIIGSESAGQLTRIIEAVNQSTKGVTTIMHQLALLKAENQSLRQANEVLSNAGGLEKHVFSNESHLFNRMQKIYRMRGILRSNYTRIQGLVLVRS